MSITLNGSSFNITYSSGVSSDFEEQSGAVLTVDPWGMDSITRRYTGRLDKVTAELAKYKRNRNKKDAVYPWLYFTDLTVTEDSPFAVLSVTYKGVYDGKNPEPVIEPGYRAQSVSLPFTSTVTAGVATLTSETVTLKYYAPFSTFKYLLRTKPTGAKFRNAIEVTQDALRITSVSGGNRARLAIAGANFGGTTASPIPMAAQRFNGVVEILTTDFRFPKVGQWYQVTETNEAQIVANDLSGRASVYQI